MKNRRLRKQQNNSENNLQRADKVGTLFAYYINESGQDVSRFRRGKYQDRGGIHRTFIRVF